MIYLLNRRSRDWWWPTRRTLSSHYSWMPCRWVLPVLWALRIACTKLNMECLLCDAMEFMIFYIVVFLMWCDVMWCDVMWCDVMIFADCVQANLQIGPQGWYCWSLWCCWLQQCHWRWPEEVGCVIGWNDGQCFIQLSCLLRPCKWGTGWSYHCSWALGWKVLCCFWSIGRILQYWL